MPQTEITHPLLGAVTINESSRAHRISIAVRPDGSVRLTVPRAADVGYAMRFLESKAGWVVRARARQQERSAGLVQVLDDGFTTRCHTLRLVPSDTGQITVRVADGAITVRYPDGSATTDPAVQEAAKRGVERAWRAEAAGILPGMLEGIARRHGLRYRSVTVRNTVSKWGSCSARDDISLSLHLMRLPDELIGYVLLHELCHTVHKNHGPRFHSLLDRLSGGRSSELRRELRRYHTRW